MNYPRDELWLRKAYEPLVISQQLTTVFKPGNRLSPNPKGFSQGEIITIKILESPGDEMRDIAPMFTGTELKVKIKNIELKNIDYLSPTDFNGSSPDVKDKTSLEYHLGLLYNSSQKYSQITKIEFEYL